MGFYQPERGDILLDGQSIRTVELASLRRKIAYVDQATFLFSDTILNNLRLGNTQASMEDIQKACRISHAAEFIEQLPMGYHTPLDENGTNLSGGRVSALPLPVHF